MSNRLFIKRVVDIDSLINLDKLRPMDRVMASIQYQYVNSKAYQRKMEEIKRKEHQAKQAKQDRLRNSLLRLLHGAFFKGNVGPEGVELEEVYVYIPEIYADVMLKVLDSRDLADYVYEIIDFNVNKKSCFKELPYKVKFKNKVL